MDVDQWRDLVARARSARGGSAGRRMREAAVDQLLEADLRTEQAASLARSGRRLGAACASASEVAGRLATTAGPDRAELLERYRELCKEAKLARWELVVQREAIGLRNHHDLDESYPLPLSPAALGLD